MINLQNFIINQYNHIGIDNRIENYDVLDDDLGTQGRITLTLTCNINKISDRESIESMKSFLHESYDEYFSERITNLSI